METRIQSLPPMGTSDFEALHNSLHRFHRTSAYTTAPYNGEHYCHRRLIRASTACNFERLEFLKISFNSSNAEPPPQGSHPETILPRRTHTTKPRSRRRTNPPLTPLQHEKSPIRNHHLEALLYYSRRK
uniref:Uncharacterized protein n=1 Tax=Physcomitrium patens TaxID=3218 RepID=A9S433_PHYPA|nr:hypothetical protein PHYPA_016393 [Physcomitrium patens]